MTDSGKLIRNGAEIQIDENGGIIARPADGQKLIVEDDAVVGSLEAEEATIAETEITNATILRGDDGWQTVEGSSRDERLDNALAQSSTGDTIYLERGDYSKTRTGSDAIEDGVCFVGCGGNGVLGTTRINADWDIEALCKLENIRVSDVTVNINSRCMWSDLRLTSGNSEIVVNADSTVLSQINAFSTAGDITFASGTEDGVIGLAAGNVSITDNGNNQVI